MDQSGRLCINLCTQTIRRITAISAMLGLVACQRESQNHPLPQADATECKLGAYALEITRGGEFFLNREQRDSAGVSNWIRHGLAESDTALRIVFISVDSGRRNELRWLIPAIRSVGGRAYTNDGSCAPVMYEVTPSDSSSHRP